MKLLKNMLGPSYFGVVERLPEKHAKKISQEELRSWMSTDLITDILKGITPGCSFCQRFDIIDYILIFCNSDHDYLSYIKKTYLAKE